LELLQETVKQHEIEALIKECDELTAIFTASLKTARSKSISDK
jgi:hypothetical protein